MLMILQRMLQKATYLCLQLKKNNNEKSVQTMSNVNEFMSYTNNGFNFVVFQASLTIIYQLYCSVSLVYALSVVFDVATKLASLSLFSMCFFH